MLVSLPILLFTVAFFAGGPPSVLDYIILFLPMIVVIAFRPQGLFGRVGA